IDLVSENEFYLFGNSIPVQTNLSNEFLSFNGFVDPSDNNCNGACIAFVANLSPTQNDIKNGL
ncbi:21797_t:CDS:1, partial [Gigaspora rosea]